MSIKLMDGKRVVDFRIQETRVKEEVKVTPKEINENKDDFDLDFMQSKWFRIISIIFILGVLILQFGFPKKSVDERLGYQVGNYEYTHRSHGEPVYRLNTPRGPEWVRGYENLQTSLEVYAESGVMGADYREVSDKDVFVDLTKSEKEIKAEIEQQEKEVEEFDKENLQPEEK